MALDLRLREDVVRILTSTHETMRSALAAASSDGQDLDAHHLAFTDGNEQAFTNVLRELSMSFGLASPGGPSDPQGWTPASSFLAQAPPGDLESTPAGGWALNQDGWDRR